MKALDIYLLLMERVYKNFELPFGAKQKQTYEYEFRCKKAKSKSSPARDSLADQVWNFYRNNKLEKVNGN
jgi:hypothetical protein